MAMWFSSKASQIDVPALARISAPCGQYSAWGRILMMGLGCLHRGNIFAGKRLGDAPVHALGGKGFGGLGQRLGLRFYLRGIV